MAEILEFPGFIDVHVHFRDPGVPEAETRQSGAAAAYKGGMSGVVTMPNTTPAGDSVEWIRHQIEDTSLPISIFPSACITVGRLGEKVAELERLADAGAAFFTDDGTFVTDAHVMEEAMKRAYKLDMVLSQHALAPGFSEADAIRRDLSICRVAGARLHIQHISTAEGVDLVRSAVKEGLPVTAEACPHHLLMCLDEIESLNGNHKMAPPLAHREDRDELRRAVKEGLLMFATDHAPHPAAKKCLGYEKSANGIIGLETAIAITYEVMVQTCGMEVQKWAEAWWKLPRTILSRACEERVAALEPTKIEVGEMKRFDLSKSVSLSRNCPYDGFTGRAWPCR